MQQEARPGLVRWQAVALFWIGMGLINATNVVLMYAEGMEHPWLRLFITDLILWSVWAFATVPLLGIVQRLPTPRWADSKTWWPHLALLTAIVTLDAAWATGVYRAIKPLGPVSHPDPLFVDWWHTALSRLSAGAACYTGILMLGNSLQSRRRLVQQETEAARLQAQLSEARLDALQRQLEPHFLFNTLNGIAGLVRESRNDAAIRTIVRLSDLLRRLLDNSDRQEVPLGEELEFLERYLEIQKMRFTDRLSVAVAVSPDLYGAKVPSLVLQPLVENAIQHGISRIEGLGSIQIAARHIGSDLTLSVQNDGCALPDDWDITRSGIGLANTRARLRSLYGDHGELAVSNAPGGVLVTVRLPFRDGRSCQ